MGCQQSNTKGGEGGGLNAANFRQHLNADHLPPVPEESWYAFPFTEETPMEMTNFHAKVKGEVLFSTQQIPTRASELASLSNREPVSTRDLTLGDDPIYGMGYLHNTALYIEHYWRTRVNHTFPGEAKFDRPFYTMLLGVKVFINGELVPDQLPGADSLLQCTATIRAHEATSTWLCVPMILCPGSEDPESCHMLHTIELYRGLCLSFCLAAQTLVPGEHVVRVEICYGCRPEANFCTDFIARGAFTLHVTPASQRRLVSIVDKLAQLISKSNASRSVTSGSKASASDAVTIVPLRRSNANAPSVTPCPFCGAALKYTCTICGASVCGSTSCVWSKFVGYPFGCQTHKAQ